MHRASSVDQNAALVQLAERFGYASVGSELVIPNRFFALYIWGSPNSYQLIMTNKVDVSIICTAQFLP